MPLTISKGNMKLGNIPNLSLPPIKTCRNNQLCAKKCYAMKSFRQYPNVRKAWEGNLRLWKRDPKAYFGQLDDWLHKHNPAYFRFHVGGDCPDKEYMSQVYTTAYLHPRTQFLMFTKRWDMLHGETRPNLHIIISRWPGDQEPRSPGPADNYAQAWVQDPKNPDARIPADAYKCPGSCMDCKYCFHAVPKQNVVFHIH